MKLGGKDMLKQAQPHFETFKALFTHGVLGISRAGRPIWVMRVGIHLHLRPPVVLGICTALLFRHNILPKSACMALLGNLKVLFVDESQAFSSLGILGVQQLSA